MTIVGGSSTTTAASAPLGTQSAAEPRPSRPPRPPGPPAHWGFLVELFGRRGRTGAGHPRIAWSTSRISRWSSSPAVTTHASSFCANSSIISSSFGADLVGRRRAAPRAPSSLARFFGTRRRPCSRRTSASTGAASASRPPSSTFANITPSPHGEQRDDADVVAEGVDLHVEPLHVAAERLADARRAPSCASSRTSAMVFSASASSCARDLLRLGLRPLRGTCLRGTPAGIA